MPESTPPSFPARYWEAAKCVAASGRGFARMSYGGLEFVVHALTGYERPTTGDIRADARRLARGYRGQAARPRAHR
jgi:CRISPR/Cas system Type II protein with McrA/HNH and RuvC-like nuclease domain